MFPPLCIYTETKLFSHLYLANMPDTLLVCPGRLFGGTGSRQLDALLAAGIDEPLTIDNVHVFEPTYMPAMCDAFVKLLRRRRGLALLYGDEQMTAVEFAKDVLGMWGSKWIEGEFHDVAPRPFNISLRERFPEALHIPLEIPRATALRQL
jgi:hypothetical protein